MVKNITKSDCFLSIIIPVYNVEKYLRRCIDSIVYQKTNFEYEIIAVDDCSTDNSIKILSEYEKDFNNFHLIKNDINSKLSIARKYGIDKSIGRYVMHVDSDDWIVKNCLQKIHDLLFNVNNPEIIVFNYFTEDSFGYRKSVDIINQTKKISKKDKIHNLFLGAVWNKVVKKELLINNIYGEVAINNAEDLVYSTEIYLKAQNIVISNYSFYVYFSNLKSLSKSADSYNFLLNQVQVLDQISDLIKRYNPSEERINFILKYFIKFIYLEIYNFNYIIGDKEKKKLNKLFKQIFSYPYFNHKIRSNLARSLRYKPYVFIEIFRFFGLKKTFKFILKHLMFFNK